jgi:D-alanine-D-alanine ligase
VLHSLPEPGEGRLAAEFDLSDAVRGLADALPGAAVVGVRGQPGEVMSIVAGHAPDVVFNAVEAPLGRPDREAHVAALLEWMGVRFTGSSSETLALCRRKDHTRAVLGAAGVRVPRTGVFPCFVKPADEDGSAGITDDNVCVDEAALERALARVRRPTVEEYLPGRELAVALWADQASVGEVKFARGLRVLTYASKWDPESPDYERSPTEYPAERVPPGVVDEARAAWAAVGGRGYGRVDVRLDAAGAPRVIDVNPNPDLSPGAGLYRAVYAAGWTWERFVSRVVEDACA